MKNNSLKLVLLFIGGMILLTPNFYKNIWNTIETDNYNIWQMSFDRVVVARLVKIRQDGFFSAGGFLGLGDVKEWDFKAKTTAHQYEVYENGKRFKKYLAYESLPGFQALAFNFVERITNFPPKINLDIFRGMVAVASSMILSLVAVWLANEFGWLPAILVLFSSAFSKWLILPAGSIFWNLWAFYLPLIIGLYLLAYVSKERSYHTAVIFWSLFFTSFIKILINGFEVITTTLVMATVPFIYYAARDRWGWSLFLSRMLRLGLALLASVISGLLVLAFQITALNGNFPGAISYIMETTNRRVSGNPENYTGAYAESMRASYFEVIWKYLDTSAFTIRLMQFKGEIMYFHLIILFAIFTALFLFKRNSKNASPVSTKGDALVITTWYSVLAPLSWFIIFKPNAYIHTFLYPMVWHMPFILFGFALSAFVFQSIFIKHGTDKLRP